MPCHHTVRPSDTLAVIARECDVPYPELIRDWPGNRDRLPQAPRHQPASYIKPDAGIELEIPRDDELQPTPADTDQRHVYRVLGPKVLHMLTIDAHMHIQSLNCTPLPLQYGVVADRAPPAGFLIRGIEMLHGTSVLANLLHPRLLPRFFDWIGWRVTIIARLVSHVPNRVVITALNMIMMRKFAILGNKPTSWIGGRHVRYSKAAARSELCATSLPPLPLADKPLLVRSPHGPTIPRPCDHQAVLSVDAPDKIMAISVALTMDMDFAHVDGYYGESIYNHHPRLGTYYRLRMSGTWSRHVRPYIPVNGNLEANPVTPLMTQLQGMNASKALRLGRKVHDRMRDLDARRSKGQPVLGLDLGPNSGVGHGIELAGHALLDNLKRFQHPELALLMSHETWQQQLWHTERALVRNPFRLFALLHYDPRRILHDVVTPLEPTPLARSIKAVPVDDAPPFNGMDPAILEPFSRIVGRSPEGLYLGFKLYTSQGYMPADPVKAIAAIQRKFYANCITHDLPLMNHCVPGGYFTHQRRHYLSWFTKQAQGKFSRHDAVELDHDWNDVARSLPSSRSALDSARVHELGFFYEHFVHPDAWGKLLQKPQYAKLRLCLAHFAADDQLWREDPDKWTNDDLSEAKFIALKHELHEFLRERDERWSSIRRTPLTAIRRSQAHQEVLDEIIEAQNAINKLDRTTATPRGATTTQIELLSIKAYRPRGELVHRYTYRPMLAQVRKNDPAKRVSILRWAVEQLWGANPDYAKYNKPVFDDNGIMYRRSWLRAIAELCRDYDNCHVDISYLRLSKTETSKGQYQHLMNWQTLGKVMNKYPVLVRKILYGSDWYVYKTDGSSTQQHWYNKYYEQAIAGMMKIQQEFLSPGKGNPELCNLLECNNLFVQLAVINPLRFYRLTPQSQRAQQMYGALQARLKQQYQGSWLDRRQSEMDENYCNLQAIIQNLPTQNA